MKAIRLALPLLALALTVSAAAAQYQDERYQQQRSGGGFFDGLFGGSERMRPAEPQRRPPQRQERYQQPAQDEGDLAVEVDRLRNRVRQLTGQVEELEHRNRQLEQQLQAQGGGAPAAPRAEAPRQVGPAPHSAGQLPPAEPGSPAPPLRQSQNEGGVPATGSVAGRRGGDAFDPDANPTAPGVPKALGSPDSRAPQPVAGERERGEPLDLGHEQQQPAEPPRREARTIAGPLPAPAQRGANGAQPQPVSAPAATPRDAFAAAQGHMQKREYAQAETSLREFLKKYPGDRLAGDAHYQLGESFYQRQNYREAAESFLTVSTKYGKIGKAPDALLRLGQSLAALGEKDAACATLSEVGRKYPNASNGVKQSVERERTRAKCS